jgi:CNT family concentrative nucleoside transporter
MAFQGVLGILAFLFIAWILSENRRKISLYTTVAGLGLQLILAVLLLKFSFSDEIFLSLNRVVMSLEESTQAGTSFVFGYLGGGELPYEARESVSTYILAFRALPLILFLSALSSLFFYWNILPVVVRFFSRLLEKTLRIGGAEGLGVGGNIFLGMVESPLFIRPYLVNMSRSELFTVMATGMATIAGTVMVLYASILSDVIPNVLGHILTASILNAPAAVVISKILIPQTEEPTSGELTNPEPVHNAMEAITQGTLRGVQLFFNVVAMLIVLVALVYLANLVLGLLPNVGAEPITLQRLFGIVMAPVVWLMGVPWSESGVAGGLMGTKTVINELVAYLDMSRLPEGALSSRSYLILTYAMCGFANPGSIGIMIGGLGTLVPERRNEIVSLGFLSLLAGTLATCMTGALVGILE